MMSKLYPKLQTGGSLSQLGYKRHSPYNKASSLLIHTPTGSITMKEVDHPILGIGKGEIKMMLPELEYQFKSNKVLEIPMRSLYPKKYQQGGTTPEMSPEQKQEIIKRVRNLRKTIGYNKVQGVPLDGIALRHKLHVNKHLIRQEDQELLSAFDENQILDLMNNVPDDDQPMFKKGGSIKGKSKMYPKCKCGCGGMSVGKVKTFEIGGTMDVLDGDGNSQMKIEGGERIFSRIATKKMLQLNEAKNYTELGKFICDELKAQDEREPQYVKE